MAYGDALPPQPFKGNVMVITPFSCTELHLDACIMLFEHNCFQFEHVQKLVGIDRFYVTVVRFSSDPRTPAHMLDQSSQDCAVELEQLSDFAGLCIFIIAHKSNNVYFSDNSHYGQNTYVAYFCCCFTPSERPNVFQLGSISFNR